MKRPAHRGPFCVRGARQRSAAAFTDGSTWAFLVGAAMILVASLVIWIVLDVKHAELATDGPEAAVHVG